MPRTTARPRTADIAIVGAGPIGLATAVALARLDLRVILVDTQPRKALAAPTPDGREIALTHASVRALRALGIWRHLPADAASPLREAHIFERDASRALRVAADGQGHDRLGNLVSNHLLRAAAWTEAVDHAHVDVHAGSGVHAVRPGRAAIELDLVDGSTHRVGLLVAADSRFSRTRQMLGIATDMHDFGRHMLVCRMRHETDNAATAWQWFGDAQTRALLPLAPQLSSVVLTLPGHEADRMAQLDDDAFAREVEHRFQHRLGAMHPVGERHRYPLVATYAHRFVAPRAALVGDAAVGMHPVTAHGFNLGLAGVERLSAAVALSLARHADPGDPRALAGYERRHRRGTRPLYLATRAVAGLYGDDRPALRPLRRAAIEASARLAPFRRALASGLIDDGPVDPPLAERLRGMREWLHPAAGR